MYRLLTKLIELYTEYLPECTPEQSQKLELEIDYMEDELEQLKPINKHTNNTADEYYVPIFKIQN